MREYLNSEEKISNTQEELRTLCTINQDILDKYLKPTRRKKNEWMTEDIFKHDGR